MLQLAERQSRIQAGLEELTDLRAGARLGVPVDRARFDAAVAVIASALDDSDKRALAETMPASKATLDADELGILTSFAASKLLAALPAPEGTTKGLVFVPTGYDANAAAADNFRRVMASEAHAAEAKATALRDQEDAKWIQTWLEHGRRRARLVRLVKEGMTR